MPDVLHWLGIRKIHRLVSMSNMKYDAITGSGIEVGERVEDPGRSDSGRRARRDGREEGRRLLHRRRGAGRHAPRADQGPHPVTVAVAPPAAATLLSTTAIRERCGNIAAAVSAGQSRFFRIDRARLDAAAARVAAVTRERYPTLAIPYHSRWRHFEAGGVDRRAELERALAARPAAERARAQIDLAVVSVLLDAGRGRRLGLRRSRVRAALHALRGPRGGELPRVHVRRVLRDPRRSAARGCRGAGDDRRRAPGAAVPGARRQSARGPRRPRGAAAAAGRCARARRAPCSATARGPARCSTC